MNGMSLYRDIYVHICREFVLQCVSACCSAFHIFRNMYVHVVRDISLSREIYMYIYVESSG